MSISTTDIDALENFLLAHDSPANNVNTSPLKFKGVLDAARAWVAEQARVSQRSTKVTKAQPVEVKTPAKLSEGVEP